LKTIKLTIKRCGDCPAIRCVKFNYWECRSLNERVQPDKIALMCPLDDCDEFGNTDQNFYTVGDGKK